MAGRALIFGGGQIGQACAAALVARDWRVEVLTRSTVVGGRPFDRSDEASLAAALAGGTDLLVDTIGYNRADADRLLPFANDIGQLATISSVSVYADASGHSLDSGPAAGFPDFDGPITEIQPTVAPGDDRYSTRKVAMEQRLLDAMACPVVVLRPCAVHGVGSRHPREWWFVKRLLDGRTFIPLAYGGSSRFQTSAATSIGALVAVLAAARQGGIFNIADPDAPTVAEIGHIIAAQLGLPLAIHALEGPPRGHVGESPWCVPRPFVVASDAAMAAGYRPAGGYAMLVAPLLGWLEATAREGDWRARFPVMAGYGYDPFDYAAEAAA